MGRFQLKRIVVAAVAAVCILVAVLVFRSGREPVESDPLPARTASGKSATAIAPSADPAGGDTIVVPVDVVVDEYVYLPNSATLEGLDSGSSIDNPGARSGSRRLRGIRELIPADGEGGFIAPRISPDGLQIMMTRPGFRGIYVASMRRGDPERISDLNAWGARWTDDGLIEVRTQDGMVQVLGPDGTIQEVRAASDLDEPVFADADVIMVRAEDGSTRPLTGNEDNFYGPMPSGDGEMVAYQGLNSGIYVARADGTDPPVHLGDGTNPTWMRDGSGVLFEVSTDDGHDVVAADLYYADSAGGERTNLTEDFDGVCMRPSVGPDGSTVAFESEGGVFVGEMR